MIAPNRSGLALRSTVTLWVRQFMTLHPFFGAERRRLRPAQSVGDTIKAGRLPCASHPWRALVCPRACRNPGEAAPVHTRALRSIGLVPRSVRSRDDPHLESVGYVLMRPGKLLLKTGGGCDLDPGRLLGVIEITLQRGRQGRPLRRLGGTETPLRRDGLRLPATAVTGTRELGVHDGLPERVDLLDSLNLHLTRPNEDRFVDALRARGRQCECAALAVITDSPTLQDNTPDCDMRARVHRHLDRWRPKGPTLYTGHL